MQRVFQGLVAALVLAGTVSATAARPVVPAEKRFWSYDGQLPSCDNPDVLDRVSSRFEATEHEYWNSSLAILSYDQVSTRALRPWGLDHIPRNYCRARALFNDNTHRDIVYSVAEDQGIIGTDFGVDWCVVGLDRNYAYAPSCKMETP